MAICHPDVQSQETSFFVEIHYLLCCEETESLPISQPISPPCQSSMWTAIIVPGEIPRPQEHKEQFTGHCTKVVSEKLASQADVLPERSCVFLAYTAKKMFL